MGKELSMSRRAFRATLSNWSIDLVRHTIGYYEILFELKLENKRIFIFLVLMKYFQLPRQTPIFSH